MAREAYHMANGTVNPSTEYPFPATKIALVCYPSLEQMSMATEFSVLLLLLDSFTHLVIAG